QNDVVLCRSSLSPPSAVCRPLYLSSSVIEDHKEEKSIRAFPISWEAWALCALESSAIYVASSSGVPVALIPAAVINNSIYTKTRNVAGLSTSDAQKSSDMFAKCRYM